VSKVAAGNSGSCQQHSGVLDRLRLLDECKRQAPTMCSSLLALERTSAPGSGQKVAFWRPCPVETQSMSFLYENTKTDKIL